MTKKFVSLTLLGFLCFSCNKDSQYKTLIDKLKNNYVSETRLYSSYTDGTNVYASYFIDDDDDVVIACKVQKDSSPNMCTVQYTVLESSSDVPSTFDCGFIADYTNGTSYVGYYNISKHFSVGRTPVSFYSSTFPDLSTKLAAQDVAAWQTSLTILALEIYITDNYGMSLKDVGMWSSFVS